MKFLQIKAAMDAAQALSLAPVDIVEIFKRSGYQITTNDCKMPKPLWEQATLTMVGDALKLLIPVQVKYLDSTDISPGWLQGTLYIIVMAGSDLSVLVEGSW